MSDVKVSVPPIYVGDVQVLTESQLRTALVESKQKAARYCRESAERRTQARVQEQRAAVAGERAREAEALVERLAAALERFLGEKETTND